MSDMSEELKVLIAKEAIRDQIYTYCHALDRIDNELGYTVFSDDAVVDYGPFYKGTGHGFIDHCLNAHRGQLATHHMMTNVLIKVDGDKAVSETYMYAANKYPMDDGRNYSTEARCRDIDNWECRDGKWVIVKRIVAGDNTRLLSKYKDLENYNTCRGDNCREDPSYILFPELKK